MSSVFGRDEELAQLEAALDDAAAGRGRSVCVLADAGIGKTRLFEELAARAQRRGAHCAWGVGFDDGGAPPYAAVVDACRALAARTGHASLATAASALASTTTSAGTPSTPGIDPEERRFVLFSDLARALASLPAPAALFFDDAHAFDRASLSLLAYLARALRADRVLLACAWRPSEARRAPDVDAALSRLARESRVFHLGPLAERDVAALASAALGVERGAAVAADLARRSGGNALFVVEMLGRAKADPDKRLPDAIPETVRGVIASRMLDLDAAAHEALEAAAVAGGEVRLPLVAALLGVSVEAALARLDHAVRAGFLVDDGGLRLRFAHPLFREALAEGLDPARRRALHDLAARHLIASSSSGIDVPPQEIAHHLVQAGGAANSDELCAWTERAARRAMQVGADDEAAAIVERALPLVGGVGGAGGPARESDLLVVLAEARARAGDLARGKEAAVRAAAIARGLGDGRRLARAALAHGHEIVAATIDPALVALLEEALRRVSVADDAMLHARVAARLAAARQPADDPNGPIELARAALAEARAASSSSSSREDLARALHHAGSALVEFAPAEERAPLSQETIALALEIGDVAMALANQRRLAVDRLELGDLAGAESAVAAYDEASRHAPPRLRAFAPMLRVMLAHERGDFADMDERRAELDAILSSGSHGGHVTFAAAMQGIAVAVASKPAAGVRAALDTITQIAPGSGTPRRAAVFAGVTRAVGLSWLGDTEAAIAAARGVPYDRISMGHGSMGSAMWAEILFLLDDAEGARVHLDMRMRKWLTWGQALVLDGPGDRPHALLLALVGRVDEAAALLAQAAASMTAAGLWTPALRVEFDLARVLVRARDSRAQRAVDDARRTAEKLGSPNMLARLDDLSAVSGARANVDAVSLTKDGEVWRVSFRARTTTLKDSRGMSMLARLLSSPGSEITASDLEGQAVVDLDSAPALDDDAKRAYRARLRELEAEIDDGLPAAVERAHAERDAIEAELSRATGMFGRDRKIGNLAERARVNVQRRLKDAIQRIASVDAEAGAFLEKHVKTGATCVFRV